MTQPEAKHTLHSAAEIREAVDILSKGHAETVLLAWSDQVHHALQAEGLSAADIAARGGPAERTVGMMLKAYNTTVSTMVQFATALSNNDADYELEIRLVRKPKSQASPTVP